MNCCGASLRCKRRHIEISKGLPVEGLCFLCRHQGHVSVACPLLASGSIPGYRCIAADDLVSFNLKREWRRTEGEPLSPLDHVWFGNTHTRSLWFSAARHTVDPAYFWSTRNVIDGSCRANGGKNWESQYVAMLDLNQCDIYADVSSGPLAAAHGISKRNQLDIAIAHQEVILRAVPHNAVLAVRSVRDIICTPCVELSINESSREATDRWVAYASWAERGAPKHRHATRPQWLPG